MTKPKHNICQRCGVVPAVSKWCKPCAKIINKENVAKSYQRNKHKYLEKNKKQGVKTEQCECPTCGARHKKDVNFTGRRFYFENGKQKPLPFYCPAHERRSKKVEPETAKYHDVRFAYAKGSV